MLSSPGAQIYSARNLLPCIILKSTPQSFSAQMDEMATKEAVRHSVPLFPEEGTLLSPPVLAFSHLPLT